MRIRDRIRGSRVEPARGPKGRPRPGKADPHFTHKQAGHTWSYGDGKIFIDGHDINPVISEEEPTISTLVGLASGLGGYKKKVGTMGRRGASAGKLMGLIDALLEKILGKVKRVYDQKMYGLSWTLKNNELIINGISVQSFLALYRVRRTRKAKKFLKGLKKRVDMLVSNQARSSSNEKVRHKILAIQKEIDEELAAEASTSDPHRLLHSGSAGS